MPNVNAEGLKLIKDHEGLRLNAYPDPAHGWKVPTIGYGHTSAAGEPIVTKGLKITADEASEILRRDLNQFGKQVLSRVKVPLDDNQFSALVSFAFNLGIGNFEKSTLLKKLNARDYLGAANEFKRWNKAAGKVLPGLVKRRAAEAALFSKPVKAGSIPIVPVEVAPPKPIFPFPDLFGRRSKKVTDEAKPVWGSGLVTNTLVQYLVAFIGGGVAVKFGLDPDLFRQNVPNLLEAVGAIGGALLAILAAFRGMKAAATPKAVVAGEVVPLKDMTATDQKAVAAIVKKSK